MNFYTENSVRTFNGSAAKGVKAIQDAIGTLSYTKSTLFPMPHLTCPSRAQNRQYGHPTRSLPGRNADSTGGNPLDGFGQPHQVFPDVLGAS